MNYFCHVFFREKLPCLHKISTISSLNHRVIVVHALKVLTQNMNLYTIKFEVKFNTKLDYSIQVVHSLLPDANCCRCFLYGAGHTPNQFLSSFRKLPLLTVPYFGLPTLHDESPVKSRNPFVVCWI